MGFLKKKPSIKIPSSKPSPSAEAIACPLSATPSTPSTRSDPSSVEEERRDDERSNGSPGLEVNASESRASAAKSSPRGSTSSVASVTRSHRSHRSHRSASSKKKGKKKDRDSKETTEDMEGKREPAEKEPAKKEESATVSGASLAKSKKKSSSSSSGNEEQQQRPRDRSSSRHRSKSRGKSRSKSRTKSSSKSSSMADHGSNEGERHRGRSADKRGSKKNGDEQKEEEPRRSSKHRSSRSGSRRRKHGSRSRRRHRSSSKREKKRHSSSRHDDDVSSDDESVTDRSDDEENSSVWSDATNLVSNASHFFRNLTVAKDDLSTVGEDVAASHTHSTEEDNARDVAVPEEVEEEEEGVEVIGFDDEGTANTRSTRGSSTSPRSAKSRSTQKISNRTKVGGRVLKEKFLKVRSRSFPKKDKKDAIIEGGEVEVSDGEEKEDARSFPTKEDADKDDATKDDATKDMSKDDILFYNEDEDEEEDEDTADEDTADEDTAAESATQYTASTAESNETLARYIKRMERFKVKNPEHQLVVKVVEHGHIENMLLQELSYVPKPRPDEIVIKVEASTISLQDCMIRRGKWYEMQKLPFVPGSDFVGTVHAMGYGAAKKSPYQAGHKVAGIVPSGGNAKYITLPYDKVIPVPRETDSAVTLCLSSAYVPAREALDLARKLNTPFTDANVLVIGGNGPSGLATIELALLEGANVFTVADERHHEFLTKMGAKCHPVDPSKWLPTLGGKMDVVLDSVCLDGYESSRAALNPAGTLVCTGMSAVYTQGQIRAFGVRDIRDIKAMQCRMRAKYMWKNAVYYDRLERYDQAPNEYAQHVSYLCHLAAKGSITPLISARAPLNLVPSMHKAIENVNTTYGVCVCTPWATKTIDGDC